MKAEIDGVAKKKIEEGESLYMVSLKDIKNVKNELAYWRRYEMVNRDFASSSPRPSLKDSVSPDGSIPHNYLSGRFQLCGEAVETVTLIISGCNMLA